MTGTLRVRMSQDWRALGYAPDPIETARIEARIPSGHYLYVSTVGRRPNEWRVRLYPDPVSDPLWDETVGGTCVHAIHVALARHEAPANFGEQLLTRGTLPAGLQARLDAIDERSA